MLDQIFLPIPSLNLVEGKSITFPILADRDLWISCQPCPNLFFELAVNCRNPASDGIDISMSGILRPLDRFSIKSINEAQNIRRTCPYSRSVSCLLDNKDSVSKFHVGSLQDNR
jgi:hypothetical protein